MQTVSAPPFATPTVREAPSVDFYARAVDRIVQQRDQENQIDLQNDGCAFAGLNPVVRDVYAFLGEG